MAIIKIAVYNSDGTVWYTSNALDLRKIELSLPKHIEWKHGVAAETLRNKYFIMLTELSKTLKTGDTKADLHEYMKPLIMKKFLDFPQYFTNGKPEYSTRNLTRQGWIAVIEQLKSVALDVFDYTFKDQ